MSFLIKTVETHRVNTENAAVDLIEDAKKDGRFILTTYKTDYKTVKAKGEVIDEYWLVTLTKQFTDAKEPCCTAKVSYTVENGVFPDPIVKDEDDEEEEDMF